MNLFLVTYEVTFFSDGEGVTGSLYVEAEHTSDATAKAETALAELLGSFDRYAWVETGDPEFIQAS